VAIPLVILNSVNSFIVVAVHWTTGLIGFHILWLVYCLLKAFRETVAHHKMVNMSRGSSLPIHAVIL